MHLHIKLIASDDAFLADLMMTDGQAEAFNSNMLYRVTTKILLRARQTKLAMRQAEAQN
jgi:hypothetical protein